MTGDPSASPRASGHLPTGVLAMIFTLAALWPALLSGGALWFPDVSPYVRGGHAAVTVLAESAEPTASVAAPPSGSAGGLASRVDRPVSGVRSVAYGVFAYLSAFPAPRFLALALVQAAALGALLALFVRRERGPVWLYALMLAIGTGPVAASTAGPDVWAGILLLAILLLTRHHATLSRLSLAFAGGCVAFAVAAHASHLLLGGALAVLALAWPRPRGAKAGGRSLLLGAVGLGVAGVAASSWIGFGEASLAPKRYPIVLARAIEDGPALWHLEEHCDEHGYAVCEVFPDAIPGDVGSFLWAEGGLRDRASPAQMDRVRAEEGLIIRRALAEYPFHQLRQAAENFAEQATMITAAPRVGVVAAWRGGGEVARAGAPVAPRAERLLRVAQGLGVVVPLLALCGLLALGYRRLDRRGAQLAALAAGGVLANAAICGVLSVPEARYQARVAWVLPLACVALAAPGLGARAGATSPSSGAAPHRPATSRR